MRFFLFASMMPLAVPLSYGQACTQSISRARPMCVRAPAYGRMLADGDESKSGNGGDDELSIGSLLAVLALQQQAKMPAADQLSLDRASLDAITDEASAELSDAWDELSLELSAVERNVSSTLEHELSEAQRTALEKLRTTELVLRRDLIGSACRHDSHQSIAGSDP